MPNGRSSRRRFSAVLFLSLGITVLVMAPRCSRREVKETPTVTTQEQTPAGAEAFEEKEASPTPQASPQSFEERPATVPGYRIQIFASTSLESATAIAEQVREESLAPVYIEYSPPFHKVRLGDCLTMSEADALKAKVNRAGYKEAIVVETEVKTGP